MDVNEGCGKSHSDWAVISKRQRLKFKEEVVPIPCRLFQKIKLVL